MNTTSQLRLKEYFGMVIIIQLNTYIGTYILMQNIEDLIKQITSSPLFKHELKTQLKQCMDDQDEICRQSSSAVTLPELVDEINGYITQITEFALEEENSKNYITFMKKNEHLCAELEKQINARIQSSSEELNSKMEAMNLKFNQLMKSTKRGIGEPCKLKDERKIITQSILETSRLQNSPKTLSTIRTNSPTYFIKKTTSQECIEANETNSSLEVELERTKVAEIEKECKRCLQVWWTKVESAIENIKKDHQRLKQTCAQLSEKAQVKLDGNLQSLWNVISDLCSRISKFESIEMLFPPAQS